jgi:tetratricopeptide (TPR) repeat protein
MNPISTSNNPAIQVIATLKQMRVSRNSEKWSEELKELLGMISVYSDMNSEFREFCISNALEMAKATSQEDRDRASVLLSVWAFEHDKRVDETIEYLNIYSTIDKMTYDIEHGREEADIYFGRGNAYGVLGKIKESLNDLDKAAQLGNSKAEKLAAEVRQAIENLKK